MLQILYYTEGPMSAKPKGRLIIIGGHEDKQGDQDILNVIAECARGDHGSLVVVTVATNMPEEVGAEYQALFKELGVGHVDVVDIRTRGEAADEKNVQLIAKA